jgi:2-polyprenyl-3-methyl-5-hydroxy-6-metoxy-1,4-benzoquinol methylase
MDQPGLDDAAHAAALSGLRRINWLSGSAGILWPELRALAIQHHGEPLRVLDVATGGGDIPIRLWEKARRAGISLRLEGCDKSPTAVQHAQQRAVASGADVHFFPLDVLAEPIPTGYDVVACSLFLHHFDNEVAVELLLRLAAAARRMILVNDLNRCITGWLLAYLGTRMLTRSPVVHIDGPLSVQAAFTPAEALALAQQAGMNGATVHRRWPFRYLLKWKPASGEC